MSSQGGTVSQPFSSNVGHTVFLDAADGMDSIDGVMPDLRHHGRALVVMGRH